ncbi:MAG: methyl-accepting chemotaxis protein [Bacteroidaceae bacterium]|nr:methyl-accepting chemotaxis protein [Bacteroidaceae bacterium]
MTKIGQSLNKTLPARLSSWVVMLVAILMVVAFVVMYRFSHRAVEEEAIERATQTLNGTVEEIDNALLGMEVAARNMLWNVEHHLNDEAKIEEYSQQVLKSNPTIVGCAIALEPTKDAGINHYHIWYTYRVGGDSIQMTVNPTVIQPELYGNQPYTEQNWYSVPKEENRTLWIKPEGEDGKRTSIVTYSIPIHNEKGKVKGVLSVDISLNWLANRILNTKPYPNAYCAMLGRNGTYIIHPDTSKLYHKTVHDLLKEQPDEEMKLLVESMLGRDTGYRAVTLNGKRCYVFYKPFKRERWSASIVCPESDIFQANRRLLVEMMLITIAALIAIFAFTLFFVRWQLKPLKKLERVAQRISQRKFGTPIRHTRRKDEIGDLQNSFGSMQKSLQQHLQQIDQLNEGLEERSEALQAAHEQVKEADHVKAVFIHNVSNKMTQPVEAIDSIVGTIRTDYAQMREEDIERLSKEVITHAQDIANLLDQMIQMAQKKEDEISEIVSEGQWETDNGQEKREGNAS